MITKDNSSLIDTFLNDMLGKEKLILREELESEFKNVLGLFEESFNSNGQLYLKSKGGLLHLKVGLANLIMKTSLVATFFKMSLIEGPSTLLLGYLILDVIDFRRIKIEGTEEEIYLYLSVKSKYAEKKSAQEWYEILPKKLRDKINKDDFKVFLNKLSLAGFAQKKGRKKYIFYKAGESRRKYGIKLEE